MSRIEDQIVFCAGMVSSSEQNAQHLKELFHDRQKQINYNLLFRRSLPVSSQVYHQLSSLEFTDPEFLNFLYRLETFESYRKRKVELLFLDLKEIAQHLKTPVILLKGAVFAHYYNLGTERGLSDIDVLVLNLDDAFSFIRLLKETGYYIGKVRLVSWERFQQTFSFNSEKMGGIAIAYRKGTGLYDGCYSSFDLAIGTFLGHNNWGLDCAIWERASVDSQFPDFLAPSAEDNLLVLLTHTLRHGRISVLDLNDAYLLLSNEKSFDWEYFITGLERNRLMPIASLLFRMLKELYPCPPPLVVRSRLKISKMNHFVSAFLKKYDRPRNENFNLGGLPLQFFYNVSHYKSENHNIFSSYTWALKSLFEMFKDERPYQTWASGELQDFPQNATRIVFVPIVPKNDRVWWQVESINLSKAKRVGSRLNIPLHQVDTTLLFWNWQRFNELILTPEGVYVQSSYSGKLTTQENIALAAAAAATIAVLHKEGSAIASPVPLN